MSAPRRKMQLQDLGLKRTQFRERSCPVCRSNPRNHVHVFRGDRNGFDLETVVCRTCGCLFTNPAPTEEALGRFYRDTYRSLYSGGGEEQRRIDRRRIDATLRWLGRDLPKTGRVLDVGADDGYLLRQMKVRSPGLELWGVEPNQNALASCEDQAGIHQVSSLDELEIRQVDFIVCLHVLEHILAPAKFLEQLTQRLPDRSGQLLLEVPNLSRLRQGLSSVHLAHLTHFTPSTLAYLLARSGLRINRIWPAGVGKWPGESVIRVLATQDPDLSAPVSGADWQAIREAFLFSVESRSKWLSGLRRNPMVRRVYSRFLRLLQK